jgi:hypothetical protein
MLTKHEAATIRAALRYWIDEFGPHDESVAKPYFDTDDSQQIPCARVEAIIVRFQESNLRFTTIDSTRLLTRNEAENHSDPASFETVVVKETLS